jgi:ubiquinone/menaquinone biosynthesis C-methylase UbiE
VPTAIAVYDGYSPIRSRVMNTETLAASAIGRLFTTVVAAGMESRFRYRFFAPMDVLRGADIRPGQTVLEIGCGTGYFTVPAARLLGDQGDLVAMDILQESVDLVSRKVETAALKNVRVVKGDGLDTGAASESFDAVLLFGLVPAPMLPLAQLIGEVHRVLRPSGTLSVWPHVPIWLPGSILRTGAFRFSGRRNGVNNFRRF